MQHKINLNGKTLLFVGVPKGAIKVLIRQNNNQSDLWYNIDDKSSWINLPLENWQLIGVYPELTEEMAKMVVEGGFCSTNGINLYQDYSKEDGTHSTAPRKFSNH